MVRFLASQLRFRSARALTLGAGILVAAVSFTLLTSAATTSRLQVQSTVSRNFRGAYDILVRPADSFTPLERQLGLVRQNYLGGIFGGISLRQYEDVKRIPDVEVAAPPVDGMRLRTVPILASSRLYLDQVVETSVERLEIPRGVDPTEALAFRNAGRFLSRLRGRVVQRQTLPPGPIYEQALEQLSRPTTEFSSLLAGYWSVSPVTYRTLGTDRLTPVPTTNPDEVWQLGFNGRVKPPGSDDVQYRNVRPHKGSTDVSPTGVVHAPAMRIVGRFDPERLPGFSPLSLVPLETYYPPEAEPADAAARKALAGRPLRPTTNIGGYLAQPPLLLTTITSLDALTDPKAYGGANHAAPVSVIRIRVAGVTLTVAAGSAVAVTGPSGSGKSTLLHLVGAMEAADAGRLVVGGHDLTELDGARRVRYRRTIGFVFQRFHLLPALTVLDNVVAPVLPYRTAFDKLARARELLAAVGPADRAGSLPSRLSGGQQQRVAIARALVNDPGLVLADEPTGNLDSGTGAEIMELLLDLRAERGMTVLVATHDPLVASRCDRVVKLHDGRITDDLGLRPDTSEVDVLAQIGRLSGGG